MRIRLHWCRNDGVPNFGDELSPRIVEHVTGRRTEWAPTESCDLAAVGSLIDRINRRRLTRLLRRPLARAVIWGTGSLKPKHVRPNPRLDVRAVRGPKTRQGLGVPAARLGDPALFLREMLRPRPKRFRWGIVPHLFDRDLPAVRAMAAGTRAATVIDVADPDPLAVAARIAECDFIASSSLHGVVAADALGVPNVWLRLSDRMIGGDWKFEDYFASLDESRRAYAPAADLAVLEEEARCACGVRVDALIAGLREAIADFCA